MPLGDGGGKPERAYSPTLFPKGSVAKTSPMTLPTHFLLGVTSVEHIRE